MLYGLNLSKIRTVPAWDFAARRILALLPAIIVSAVIGCGLAGDGGKSGAAGHSKNSAEKNDVKDTAKPAYTEQKVLIDTSLGQITVLLDREKAELTVDNFLRYVDEGHYEGTIFHEVIPGYALIGGGYDKDMKAKPTRTPVRNEARNGLKNRSGTIAMARRPDVIDSATCQFLFNLADNPALDHKDGATAEGYGYCVFGKVVEGMDVLDRIAKQKTREVTVPGEEPFPNVPVEMVMINSMRRVR